MKSLGSQLRGNHSVLRPAGRGNCQANWPRFCRCVISRQCAMRLDARSSKMCRVQWFIARRNCRAPFIHELTWEVESSGPLGRRPDIIKSRIQTPVTRHCFGKQPDCTVCGACYQSSVSDAHRHGALVEYVELVLPSSTNYHAASTLATVFASALSGLLPGLMRSVSRAFLLLLYVRG